VRLAGVHVDVVDQAAHDAEAAAPRRRARLAPVPVVGDDEVDRVPVERGNELDRAGPAVVGVFHGVRAGLAGGEQDVVAGAVVQGRRLQPAA
jgi:hypothetical protein